MGVRVAVFASGSGSNAEVLIKHFKSHDGIEVSLVVTNRYDAGVIARAGRAGIKVLKTSRKDLECGLTEKQLRAENIELIVLAGFLLHIPRSIIQSFKDRIINIHPALLPKFGGKGMYGSHVHEAVLAAGDAESGITIHLVNEEYDKGRILVQYRCPVEESDTINTLAKRIQTLEHAHFASTIEDYILNEL